MEEEYRANVGRGGILALVEEREKRKHQMQQGELEEVNELYSITLENENFVNHSESTKTKRLETKEELKEAAERIRGLTGWDCPVDAASIQAYYDVDVEGKRARADSDVGQREGVQKVRIGMENDKVGLGMSSTNKETGMVNALMEEDHYLM